MDPPDSEKEAAALGRSFGGLGSCTTGCGTLNACSAVCAVDGGPQIPS